MNLVRMMLVLIALGRQIIDLLQEAPECPDGICPPVQQELHAIEEDLQGPSTRGLGDFLKCVDIPRLVAAIQELVAVIRAAFNECPPNADA